MIINRLAVLLAERGITGARLANDTGIAQSTISKITSNKSRQVDYETLNTLCTALRIEPNDFFEYSPIDYRVEIIEDEETNALFFFIKVFLYRNLVATYEYKANIKFLVNATETDGGYIATLDEIKRNSFDVNRLDVTFDFEKTNSEKCDEFEKLSPAFTNAIQTELNQELEMSLLNKTVNTFEDEFVFQKKVKTNTIFDPRLFDDILFSIHLTVSDYKFNGDDLPF